MDTQNYIDSTLPDMKNNIIHRWSWTIFSRCYKLFEPIKLIIQQHMVLQGIKILLSRRKVGAWFGPIYNTVDFILFAGKTALTENTFHKV